MSARGLHMHILEPLKCTICVIRANFTQVLTLLESGDDFVRVYFVEAQLLENAYRAPRATKLSRTSIFCLNSTDKIR